jgi:hypothetical protein
MHTGFFNFKMGGTYEYVTHVKRGAVLNLEEVTAKSAFFRILRRLVRLAPIL